MKTQPRRVRDIMTTGIRSVTPNENLADAMIRMESARSRHLPVVRPIEGRGEVEVVGVISDRDLRLASNSPYLWGTTSEIIDSLRALRVADVMQTDLVTISPAAAIPDAARLMLERRIGMLPVVDREEGHSYLVGILSRSDILGFVSGME